MEDINNNPLKNLTSHIHTVPTHSPLRNPDMASTLVSHRKPSNAGLLWQDIIHQAAIESQAADKTRDKYVEYTASRFAEPFHQDDTSRVKALMSCVGSGKSSACIMELIRLGCLQPPAADGVRYSRTVVIRATYAQLESTTLSTWRFWLPEKICKIKKGTRITGHIHKKLADGTFLDMEFIFMALDSDQWLDNLQGLEITFFWINEFVELKAPKAVLSHLMSRLGRYPSVLTSKIRWAGGLLDYNPPRINSYAYNLFETDEKPDSFSLYKYEPPLIMTPNPDDPDDLGAATYMPNPEADYVRFQNFGYDYWLNYVDDFGSDANRIRRMVLGDYTYVDDGNPVFIRFKQSRHVGKTKQSPNRKLLIGMDGGLTPAAVFAQLIDGQLNIQKTITTDDCTFKELWELYVEPTLLEDYRDFNIQVALDKGSDGRSEVDGATIKKYLQDRGVPCWINQIVNIPPRLDSVNWFLDRHDGLLIDPNESSVMIEAMAGGYKWREQRGDGVMVRERRTVPDKRSPFSHPADALQAITMLIRYFNSDNADLSSTDYWRDDPLASRSRNTRPAFSNNSQRKDYFYA